MTLTRKTTKISKRNKGVSKNTKTSSKSSNTFKNYKMHKTRKNVKGIRKMKGGSNKEEMIQCIKKQTDFNPTTDNIYKYIERTITSDTKKLNEDTFYTRLNCANNKLKILNKSNTYLWIKLVKHDKAIRGNITISGTYSKLNSINEHDNNSDWILLYNKKDFLVETFIEKWNKLKAGETITEIEKFTPIDHNFFMFLPVNIQRQIQPTRTYEFTLNNETNPKYKYRKLTDDEMKKAFYDENGNKYLFSDNVNNTIKNAMLKRQQTFFNNEEKKRLQQLEDKANTLKTKGGFVLKDAVIFTMSDGKQIKAPQNFTLKPLSNSIDSLYELGAKDVDGTYTYYKNKDIDTIKVILPY